MKIELLKHEDGYLARIAGTKHMEAFGYTRQEAVEELVAVGIEELSSKEEIAQLERRTSELLHKLADEE